MDHARQRTKFCFFATALILLFATGAAGFCNGAPDKVWAEGFDILVDSSHRVVVSGHGDLGSPDQADDLNLGSLPVPTMWFFNATGEPVAPSGSAGFVRIPGPDGQLLRGRVVATDTDGLGRIVVGANTGDPGSETLQVQRLNGDGSPDHSFRPIGAGSGNSSSELFRRATVRHLVVDSNNRVVLLTEHTDDETTFRAVWRFNPDGTPDSTFGTDGMAGILPAGGQPTPVMFGFEDDYDEYERVYPSAVAVDNNRRIVAVGTRTPIGGVPEYQLAVWRLTADGLPDSSFGSDGVYLADRPSDGAAVAVDTDGNILVAGSSRPDSGTPSQQMTLWRFTPGGEVDPTFGSDGRVRANLGPWADSWSYGADVAVDLSGRILVAGEQGGAAALWRILPDGSFDPSFGRAGSVTAGGAAGGGTDKGLALALDQDGRILVSGTSKTPRIVSEVDGGVHEHVLAVWRFTDSGTLDPDFGSGGFVLSYGTEQLPAERLE